MFEKSLLKNNEKNLLSFFFLFCGEAGILTIELALLYFYASQWPLARIPFCRRFYN